MGPIAATAAVAAVAEPRSWDSQAPRYARQERFERAAVAALLRLAEPTRHDRVIDLATGSGLVLRALARRGPPPRSALGIDTSPGMLARVGALPPGFATLVADAAAVPLADGSADLIACSYLLHLLAEPERRAVLAEARRLLTARGRLVIATVWCDRRTPGGRLALAALAALAAARPRTLGGLAPLDPTDDVRHAGFVVTRRVQLPHHGYPSLVLAASRSRASTSR